MLHKTAAVAVWLAFAVSATACVSSSRYDEDLAKCNADAAAKLKAEQDAARARWEAEHAKLNEAITWSKKETARADNAGQELVSTREALNECTNLGGKGAKELAACQIERRSLLDKLGKVSESINNVRFALKSMSDAGKLQVKLERGFLIIALQGDILFDSGKATLKEDAKPVLLELGAVLKALPGRLFQVAGHTDSQGDPAFNWRLSLDRALSVMNFLIKEGQVDGANLSAGGYASNQPVAGNETPDGRAKNRRVEFLLVPNLADIFKM